MNAQGWTSSEVGSGTYYLYNVGAQGFMVGANDWGTQASVDATGGIPVTLAGDGAYTISTAPTYNGKFLGSNGYVDGASYAWSFEPVAGEGNVYKLKADGKYLYADAAAVTNLLAKTTSVGTDPGTNMAYWKLISKSDLFTDFGKATPASPVWASCLINNPSFGRNINNGSNDNDSGWGWTVTANNKNMSGGTNENRCAEHWQAAFTAKQTISGVPNGIYRLRVQAALTDYTNAYDGTDYPVVYIKSGDKEKTAPFNSMEGGDRGSNMNTLSNSFSAGKYFTDFVDVEVSNGEMEIGVRGTRTNTWCIYDNFQLQMYDPYVSVSASSIPAAGGALEADKWYKFSVASDGKYGFSPITNVVYTTNGEQLSSTGSGSALEEELELTAGTVYYVKSTTAQTLTITPRTFTYTVGTATADMAYVQAGKTVTVSYAAMATNNPDAAASFNLSGVTFNGAAVACTPTANGFTFVVPEVEASANYTLSIPANAVGYADGSTYNEAQDIVLKTPAVMDGTYYLYNPYTKLFLGRGSAYGTSAVVDKYGIPFNLTVGADGYANMIFLDNNQGFFGDTWCYTDNTAGSYFFENASEGDYTGFTLKRQGADTNNKVYAYTKEGGDKYRVAANATMNDNITDWAQTIWQLKTPAERNAVLEAYTTDNYQNIISAASLSTTAADFETYLTTNYAGKDYTDKVGTAKITNVVGSWTWNEVKDASNQPAYNNAAEAWCATGSWTQTIENLPVGIYRVTINAFERRANNATSYQLGEDGFGNVTSSYLKANDEQVRIKSWYEEVVKNGNTYNPNSMAEAVTAFNNDKYKSTLYTYVGDDGKLSLTIAKPNYIYDCWLLWNNITLTYYDNTVDEEAITTLLATATSQMEKPMLATLKSAISDAKTALEGSKTIANYNALQTAIENSQTSVDSYAAMKTNYLDPLADVLAKTNLYTTEAYNSVYGSKLEQYNNGTIANADANALSWNSGTNGTRAIDNLLMPSWNVGGTTFYQNTWSKEGNDDGSNFKVPFYEYWTNDDKVLTARNLVATQTGLTANALYKVTVWTRVRQSDAGDKIENAVTMQVGEGPKVDVSAGTQIGSSKLYIGEYTAVGKADADGKLTITMNVAEGSNVSWLAFKNVKYVAANAATAAEIAAYTTALADAEAKVIGFENGEYAPYNNVDAIKALADVKALNIDTEYAEQTVVTSATAALTGAVWTANVGELNAFYKGDLEGYAEDTTSPLDYTPTGWTPSDNFRVMVKNVPDASQGTAFMSWSGGVTYGEQTGYEMPLKPNAVYTLKFKAAGWNSEQKGDLIVNVKKGSEGMISYNLGKADKGHTDGMNQFEIAFATGEAGNYVFSISSSADKNMVLSDFELKKAPSQILEFADGAVPTYAPGTYPTVKITRTLTADRWATAVYPFAVSGVDNIAVLDSYDAENGILGFKSATASEANVPFLMRSTAGATEILLNNVEVAAAAAKDATASEASLKGTYAVTTVEAGEGVYNYVLSSNKIYKVGANAATIDPYRAYIQLTQPTAARALSFYIDGEETTGIEGIAADNMMNGNVYNLNGQRVESPRKGLYIKNGQKVVVK